MNSEHFLQDSITFVSKSRNTNTISHLWTCWQIQTSNTYLLVCRENLFLVEKVLYEKKVVYLQRQMDNKYLYNQYAQLCSIQKKLKT